MIDWLFIAWIVVTVLAFIDILIPDPLPFVDEAILIMLSIGLLIALFFRKVGDILSDAVSAITHPAAIAFAITFILLLIFGKYLKKSKRRK